MEEVYEAFEFVAQSGNTCRIKAYRLGSKFPIVDASWEEWPALEADIQECNAWFMEIVRKVHGSDGRISAVLVDNEDDAQALLQAHLNRPKDGNQCNN